MSTSKRQQQDSSYWAWFLVILTTVSFGVIQHFSWELDPLTEEMALSAFLVFIFLIIPGTALLAGLISFGINFGQKG